MVSLPLFFLDENNTTELCEEQMRQHLRLLILLAKLNLLRGSVGFLSVYAKLKIIYFLLLKWCLY